MTDWVTWRKHVEQKIKDEGQWVGLADENWEPIIDLPAVEELNARGTRLSPADLEAVMPAQHNGTAHLVVSELITDGLGVFSESGTISPNNSAARNIIVQRRGERSRQAYFVAMTRAEGEGEIPEKITVSGQDLMGLLAATPCPSVPRRWGKEPMKQWVEDAGGKYAKPRFYGAVEMADSLDGYTMHGPAVKVIKTLIQDSVDAVCAQMGFTRPHIVVDWSTPDESDEVLIRLSDQLLLDAVADTARVSGVTVSAWLWWPGDPHVLVRPKYGADPVLTDYKHPICVVRVEKTKGAS